MSLARFGLMVFASLVVGSAASSARAEESGLPAAPTQAPPSGKGRPIARKNRKGKYAREKEIEGSEARNRFQADTVLKSQYQLNGEPLEVDPD